VLSLTSLIEAVLTAYMLCLLGRAVFSWIEPYPRNRVHRVLFDLTEPVIAPVRRVLPPLGGLDLSFMVVFFVVMILLNLVVQLG
jgi:YggT family protein